MKSTILQAAAVVCWFISCAHALSDEEVREFMPGIINIDGSYYTASSDGLPDHKTGDFPNQGNPNSIQEQSHRFRIPVNPTYDEEGGCTPMGPVGMALNGVVFFNAFTAELSSAPECEELDDCGGHPAPRGTYHYHADPTCIKQNQSGVILGVAFDGYPICRELDANGELQTTEDQHLDKCHGKLRDDGTYCYYVSSDYPFILGCYRGKVDSSVLRSGGQGPQAGNNGPGGQRPQGGGQGPGGMCHKPFNVTPNACVQRGNRGGQGGPGSQRGFGQGGPGSQGGFGTGGPGSQGGFGQGGPGSQVGFGQGGPGSQGGFGQGGRGPSGGQGGQGPTGGRAGHGPPRFGQGPRGGFGQGPLGGFGQRRHPHGGPGKGKSPRGKRSVSVLAAGIARRASRADW